MLVLPDSRPPGSARRLLATNKQLFDKRQRAGNDALLPGMAPFPACWTLDPGP